MLRRHAALEAARAKTTALATLHATATAFGTKDAQHGFNEFLAQMDTIIATAADTVEAPHDQATAAEIAAFENLERRFAR